MMSFDLAVLSVTKLCAILGFTEEWLRASLDVPCRCLSGRFSARCGTSKTDRA